MSLVARKSVNDFAAHLLQRQSGSACAQLLTTSGQPQGDLRFEDDLSPELRAPSLGSSPAWLRARQVLIGCGVSVEASPMRPTVI